MFGCEALKSATTLSSTVFCSGASPPPRQQYQRISTGPPGGTVAGPVDGATDGADDGAPLATATVLGGGVAVVPPHALATRANATIRTPGRNERANMAPPPRSCDWSAGRCDGRRRPGPGSARGTGMVDCCGCPVGLPLPGRADDDPLHV